MSNQYTALEISKRVQVPDKCPDIILSIAPCRSGTTAQLRVFAENGIPAIYQPTKALLRSAMAGESSTFILPAEEDRIFVKETLGPYTEEESTIDPLEILLLSGVPREKITLITMVRDPINTACSWLEQFAFRADKRTLLANLAGAYGKVYEMNTKAKKLGIKEHPFVYEALRDNDPALVARRLFNVLDLPFSEESLLGWVDLPAMGTEGSGIRFPDEPNKYSSVRGHLFHEKVESSASLAYFPKSAEEIAKSLNGVDMEVLKTGKAFEIYEQVRVECSARLGIRINEAGGLDGESESFNSSARQIDRR